MISDFSEEPSSEDQLNVVEAKLGSFVHKHVWLTLPAEQGDFKVKDSRVCEWHHPDTPQLHDHTATYSLCTHREQNERCSQSSSSLTLPSTKIIQYEPVCKCPSVIQALDFSMVFNSHGPFGAFGVVSYHSK